MKGAGRAKSIIGLSQKGMLLPSSSAEIVADEPSDRRKPDVSKSRLVASAHFENSSLREKVLEHIFLSELLRHLWREGERDIDVLKAEVDASGFDVAIECRGVLRHIQLKASHVESKTREVPINTALLKKPSGCVIWIKFNQESLDLESFGWFGGTPGSQLPDLGARFGRHTRGKKQSRPRIRMIRLSAFTKFDSIEQVGRALFG